MVCKKCGNSIKSDFKYCPYCGERMISDFHDQFQDLTPPFVIHDIQEDEEALYGEPPEELPVFEEALPGYDRGQDFSEPALGPEGYGYPPPRFVRPQELDFDEQEPDYGGLDDSPYIVYHPEGAEKRPQPSRTAAPQRYRSAPEKPRIPASKAPQEHAEAGMGIGMKLAAILVTLMLAGGVSVVGYRLLMPEQPFSNPAEDGASFASVLRI